jgi:hypothetical protein
VRRRVGALRPAASAAASEAEHEQDAEPRAPHAVDATPTRYAQRASYHRMW